MHFCFRNLLSLRLMLALLSFFELIVALDLSVGANTSPSQLVERDNKTETVTIAPRGGGQSKPSKPDRNKPVLHIVAYADDLCTGGDQKSGEYVVIYSERKKKAWSRVEIRSFRIIEVGPNGNKCEFSLYQRQKLKGSRTKYSLSNERLNDRGRCVRTKDFKKNGHLGLSLQVRCK